MSPETQMAQISINLLNQDSKSILSLRPRESFHADGLEPIILDCSYHLADHSQSSPYANLYLKIHAVSGGAETSFHKHDIVGVSCRVGPGECLLSSPKGNDLGHFLLETWLSNREAIVALQIPTEAAHVAHADPWTFRVSDCAIVTSTRSFLKPLGKVAGFRKPIDNATDLAEALQVSAGAVASSLSWSSASLEKLESELRRRLALPWLSSTPVEPRRVFFVYRGEYSVTETKARWEMALAMGIRIVVVGTGKWWEDNEGPFAHLREAFITMDLSSGPELGKRIARAVSSYQHPVDGILAISDPLLVPVAEAARLLGLWTSGPEPFTICTNKFLTKQLINDGREDFFTINSQEELELRLLSEDHPVSYPVVCKPCCGLASEGVFRADNADQLRLAVAQALAIKTYSGILIEPYVRGPEVDCNVVMLHGKVLHWEVVDEFPCDADVAEDATGKLFTEAQTVTPSRLPQSEQDAIKRTVLEVLRLQGFETGIFHCEARVRNSSMAYDQCLDGRTITDLQPKANGVESSATTHTSVFLLEVNARIPGIGSSASSLIARGIDFWALQILCAASDWTRYAQFSQPFLGPESNDHVCLTNLLVPVTHKGIKTLFPGATKQQLDHQLVNKQDSPVFELTGRYPELTKYILRHVALIKDGVKYGFPDGVWLWAACLVISSPISRAHALSVGQDIKQHYDTEVTRMYYQI